MHEKLHEPAYQAAVAAAQTEIRQLTEQIVLLRMRQERISVAVEALKSLLSSAMPEEDDLRPSHPSRALYEMNNRPPQHGKDAAKVQALA